jgi:methyl-accepting chemotaxis protein
MAGLAALQGHIDVVAALTSDNPHQQARIAAMQPWVDEKLAELHDTIELRRNEGFEAARTVVLTDAGKESADQIRVIIAEMIEEERELLVVRAAATASAASTVKNIILFGSVIALAVVAGVAFYLSRAIAGGISKVSSGMQKIAAGELDEQVSITSNDELGDMSIAYNEMQEYLSQTAAVANAIANGDLTTESKPRSDKDVLGTAFSTMLVKLRGVIGGALECAPDHPGDRQEPARDHGRPGRKGDAGDRTDRRPGGRGHQPAVQQRPGSQHQHH